MHGDDRDVSAGYHSIASERGHEREHDAGRGEEYTRRRGTLRLLQGFACATCLSIAAYSALNFCAFDLFKKVLPEDIRDEAQGIATASLMATALATGSMYPLDAIRRQMQLGPSSYANVFDAGRGIVAANGVGGLFRGFIPNAMKNMPNKSIQLTTFDVLKKNIKRSGEYAKEVAALAAENKKIR